MPKPKFKFNDLRVPVQPAESETPKNVPNMLTRLEESQHVEKIPFNFKVINRSKIVANEKNVYQQIDIEELAESILQNGLIHNLEALYDEDADKYVLESGERRMRALDYLLDKYRDATEETPGYDLYLENVKGFSVGYPINVKRKKDNADKDTKRTRIEEIDSELRIHAPNLDVRIISQEDRLRNIGRRKALLEEKNALLPKKDKINVNMEIANGEGISKRQVQKYNNILSLVPELQEEFKNNNINLNEGSTYAALSKEDQLALAALIRDGKKVSAIEIKKMQEKLVDSEAQMQEKADLVIQLQKEKALLIEENMRNAEEHEKKLSEQKHLLQEQIRKELNENNPDKEKLDSLREKLTDMERASKEMLDAERRKLSQKDAEMKRLEDEIRELKKSDMSDIEKIKDEARLEMAMEQARKCLDALAQIDKERCIDFLSLYASKLEGNRRTDS